MLISNHLSVVVVHANFHLGGFVSFRGQRWVYMINLPRSGVTENGIDKVLEKDVWAHEFKVRG
jgi:hypothetical protein